MTTTTRALVLNVTEAGNLLGVSRSTAYELVRSGELKSVQLRRRVVVPVAAVAQKLGITVPDVWLALERRDSARASEVYPNRLGVGEGARGNRPLLDRELADVFVDAPYSLDRRKAEGDGGRGGPAGTETWR